ncbi:MAG: 5'/3'-nucleotidase SurE [Chloroflexi bacterium]|nr:5'/3'-nucleotidase SurE [Chloroflexota bacterium]
MMHILVTNDDGIRAPGIKALYGAMRTLPDARVTVMAPDRNQSAIGHRKTLREPLRVDEVTLSDGTQAFACSGSPSDSIALALMGFVEDPVDIVVSGINQGPNMAQDITYSGTVTAAMEAALYQIPAIAFSLDSQTEPAFEAAAAFARHIVPLTAERGLPDLTLLNVNIPHTTAIKGVRVTWQGRRQYHDELVRRVDPGGRPYYWIGGKAPTGDREEVGSDIWAVAQDYISVTPIRLDMTHRQMIDDLENWLDDFSL